MRPLWNKQELPNNICFILFKKLELYTELVPIQHIKYSHQNLFTTFCINYIIFVIYSQLSTNVFLCNWNITLIYCFIRVRVNIIVVKSGATWQSFINHETHNSQSRCMSYVFSWLIKIPPLCFKKMLYRL